MMFFLFNFEKVIVVAALFAVVLGHHIHAFDRPRRNQSNTFYVLIEPFFEIAHPRLDILSLGFIDLEKMVLLF